MAMINFGLSYFLLSTFLLSYNKGGRLTVTDFSADRSRTYESDDKDLIFSETKMKFTNRSKLFVGGLPGYVMVRPGKTNVYSVICSWSIPKSIAIYFKSTNWMQMSLSKLQTNVNCAHAAILMELLTGKTVIGATDASF